MNKLTPFKWYVLNNFPYIEQDFDALTNYQLMCKIVEYLNKIGIEVEELVNWFNDLDVQDEIDKKLDEMAESGELEEIIAQYLQVASILAFDTVAALKESTNVVDGSFVETYGYYAKNDGGNAKYKVRQITNQDVVDEMFILSLADENLIAELINEDKIINVLKLGVKNDGSQDVSNKLNSITENYSMFLPAGTYKVDSTIDLKHSLYGEGYSRDNRSDVNQTIIESSVIADTINIVGNSEYETQNIQNIKIKINNGVTDTSVITYNPVNKDTRCYINKVNVSNFCGKAINLNATSITGFISRGVYIDTICLFARPYQNSYGIVNEENVSDNRFENIEMLYVKTGILNKGLNQISNAHIWCGGTGTDQDNWWNGTRGIINQNNGKLHFANLYVDTASIAIANLSGIVMIDNFEYWLDSSISGSSTYDASIVYGNTFLGNQSVIINNAMIYIGDRVKYINGRIINLRLLYNSLSNLNLYSLHDVENLQYFINYEQESSVTKYFPVAILSLRGSGHGYSEIQFTADAGQNNLIKVSSDYENNFVIKGYYFNKQNNYYYKIDGDIIIIYMESNLTDVRVNAIITGKSHRLFPINMNALINRSTNKFIGDDYIATTTTGLTQITNAQLN